MEGFGRSRSACPKNHAKALPPRFPVRAGRTAWGGAGDGWGRFLGLVLAQEGRNQQVAFWGKVRKVLCD